MWLCLCLLNLPPHWRPRLRLQPCHPPHLNQQLCLLSHLSCLSLQQCQHLCLNHWWSLHSQRSLVFMAEHTTEMKFTSEIVVEAVLRLHSHHNWQVCLYSHQSMRLKRHLRWSLWKRSHSYHSWRGLRWRRHPCSRPWLCRHAYWKLRLYWSPYLGLQSCQLPHPLHQISLNVVVSVPNLYILCLLLSHVTYPVAFHSSSLLTFTPTFKTQPLIIILYIIMLIFPPLAPFPFKVLFPVPFLYTQLNGETHIIPL